MKVGIITFIHTCNCGAALQAYALQTLIKNKGVECDIIDYRCSYIESKHGIDSFLGNKSKKKRVIAPVVRQIYKRRVKTFMTFERSNCLYSEKKYDRESVRDINNCYDRVVVGSDQVWNLELSNDDYTYFLDFIDCNKKKYSYAASMGAKYFTNQVAKCEELVKDFRLVSVREKTSAELLASRLGVKCQYDLDPTLMLETDLWRQFLTKKSVNKDYILVYLAPTDKDTLKIIRKVSGILGCKIIWLRLKSLTKLKGITTIYNYSPIDFLNYIYHARCVITASFHATCFSILFHKEFYYINNGNSEKIIRIRDLVEELNIGERELNLNIFCEHQKIDYDKVEEKLGVLRYKSANTIDEICQ